MFSKLTYDFQVDNFLCDLKVGMIIIKIHIYDLENCKKLIKSEKKWRQLLYRIVKETRRIFQMVEVLKRETKSFGEGSRFTEIVEENFPEFKNVMP